MNNRRILRSRRFLALEALLVSVILFIQLSGCSLFRDKAHVEDIVLSLHPDSDVYRVSEPVIVTLRIQSISNDKITVYKPDVRSVDFYLVNEATGEALEVMPVFSEKESMMSPEDLDPRGNMERQFVFTLITGQEGSFSLQAFYESSPNGGPDDRPTIISPRKPFRVSGAALYQRDIKGILSKDDAIRIARERLGKSVSAEDAVLVINEAGFYDWWVTLTLEEKAGPDSAPVKKAFFINPYLARVRAEAQPRVPKTAPQAPSVQPIRRGESPELNSTPSLPGQPARTR